MEKILTKNLESQVKDLDEKKGVVTVYINSFDNEDSDGDISAKGSFKRTFKNNGHRIQHWLNHDRDKLLGVPLELAEDDFGAFAVSQLNLEKELSRDVFADYKLFAQHGKTLEHSVRVMPVKRDPANEKRVLEWKLIMEYSTLYGWGANSETPLIDIKELSDLEIMMREGNYSDDKAKLIEQTYQKLKRLLEASDSQDTLETDPSALEGDSDLIKRFYVSLKF